ncbi:MAG: heme-degrading domain-containing protein [Pseudomonas sp.]
MDLKDYLAGLSQQEQALQFEHFDQTTAWTLGSRIRDLAIERQAPVAIDIRLFAQPLFFVALPGTTPDNADWIRRKSNVVARFHRSSYSMSIELTHRQRTLEGHYGTAASEFTAHGGSFPLRVKGAGVVGSITVSGLPQYEDHRLVVKALCQHLGLSFAEVDLPAF